MAPELETVDLEVQGQTMAAVVARPAGTGPWPAIVVVAEAFGVNEYIQDVLRSLAGEGFVAIAPDFYHHLGRLVTGSYDDFPGARKLMATVTDDAARTDIATALEYLKSLPEVRADRLGVIGFWNGARLAYIATCGLPEVKALVPVYGRIAAEEIDEKTPVSPLDATPQLEADLLLIFGAPLTDGRDDEVHQLEEALQAAGKPYEIEVYGVVRGFHNPRSPYYEEATARAAWKRITDWLRVHLA